MMANTPTMAVAHHRAISRIPSTTNISIAFVQHPALTFFTQKIDEGVTKDAVHPIQTLFIRQINI